MEINNDFDREIAHLKNVLSDMKRSQTGQQFQKSMNQAGQKFQKTMNQAAKEFPKNFAGNNNPASRPATNYRTGPQSRPNARPPQPAPQQTRVYQPPIQAAQSSNIPGKTASVLLRTFGLIGLIPTALSSAIVLPIQLFALGDAAAAATFSSVMGPLVLISAVMTGVGFKLAKRVTRCKNYRGYFAGSKMMSIEQLMQLTGRSKSFLVRDIRKMVRRGMLSHVYFDAGQTCVILDDETYHQYQILENRRKNLEYTQTEATKLPEKTEESLTGVRAEGQKYIRQIRAANDALPGEEISDKLFRLETITVKIYEYIDKHPEKLDQVQRFMDYYMPTTTKLVQAYQEFEAQPVQGENILGSKKKIEDMLDTIAAAFENVLDGLFADNALDISSDISVMETMFRQDGLTKDELSMPDTTEQGVQNEK